MGPAIGYFISSHGLGHAARAAAVMDALSLEIPESIFHIFTDVAPWFFQSLRTRSFNLHPMKTDVGLVQRDPFNEDIPETMVLLNSLFPLREGLVAETAERLSSLECDLVICDIAALGIASASRAGIPSILIENFTWDWIYEAYLEEEPALKAHGEYLASLFEMADYHIQTEPVCVKKEADLTVNCVSRIPRMTRSEVRKRMGVDEGSYLVLTTVGGMDGCLFPPDQVKRKDAYLFIIPGCGSEPIKEGNILKVPKGPLFYYPDVVAACDAVVGKIGYSTLAEAYNCGVPFGYVGRVGFPESKVLAAFLDEKKRGLPIGDLSLAEGTWVNELDRVIALGKLAPSAENGSHQIARFISSILS
jgi:hypothetical protein